MTAVSPLHQFEIKTLIPIKCAGLDISFTNASLWMVIVAVFLCILGHVVTRQTTIIPGRLSVAFESIYDFMVGLLKSNLGREGRTYFPYVFPLFLFILTANLAGMLPYSFTITSHIVVTLALALTVFVSATAIGIKKHGVHFLRTFYPKGTPLFVAPILVPIEIISFLSRPISLAARLFANMVAGHVMIKIFAGFVGMLLKTPLALFSVLPILLNTALTGFEIMVALLQAYVFTLLACIYLNDALSLH